MSIPEDTDNTDMILKKLVKTKDNNLINLEEIYIGKTYETAGFFEGIINRKTNEYWLSFLISRVHDIFKTKPKLDISKIDLNKQLPFVFVAFKASKIDISNTGEDDKYSFLLKIVFIDSLNINFPDFLKNTVAEINWSKEAQYEIFNP